jgi:hypothetical protein
MIIPELDQKLEKARQVKQALMQLLTAKPRLIPTGDSNA